MSTLRPRPAFRRHLPRPRRDTLEQANSHGAISFPKDTCRFQSYPLPPRPLARSMAAARWLSLGAHYHRVRAGNLKAPPQAADEGPPQAGPGWRSTRRR